MAQNLVPLEYRLLALAAAVKICWNRVRPVVEPLGMVITLDWCRSAHARAESG